MSFIEKPLMEQLIEFNTKLVAPSEIMWCPDWDWVSDFGRRRIQKFGPEVAALLDGQLQDMRAKALIGAGPKPYIDFMHEDKVQLGEPLEFFWNALNPRGGVRLMVAWRPAAVEGILEGWLTSFSPQYVASRNAILGIGRNVGGAIHQTKKPAFERMAPIKPILKRADVQSKKERFVRLVASLRESGL